MKQLTIVIPCYNVQEVIQESFDRLSELAANVGHQQALMAGLEHAVADSDIVLSIDADLQDDINVVPQMIDSCEAGCDIVYGVRRYRQSDTFFKRSTAQLFYRMMGRMGVKTVYNHADFRLMSRRAVEHLCQYRERNLFLRGIVPLLGFPTATVCYDRSPRTAGTTKYSLAKMAWGWHEYDYSSDIYDNVLLSKRKLRLTPKKFPGMADAARKRSIE